MKKLMNNSRGFDIKEFGVNDYDEIVYLTPFGAITYQELKELITGCINDNVNINDKMYLKIVYKGYDYEKYYTIRICDKDNTYHYINSCLFRTSDRINDNAYIILSKRHTFIYDEELSDSDEYDEYDACIND